MLDDKDIFYYDTSKEKGNRRMLGAIFFVCAVNTFCCLSLCFNWQWWSVSPVEFYLLYLFILSGLNYDNKSNLFFYRRMRLKHWKNYYESPSFYEDFYNHVSLGNGDYVLIETIGDIEKTIFYKVKINCSHLGMDIDCNQVYDYNLCLVDLKSDEVFFSIQKGCYDIDDLLKKLKYMLEENKMKMIVLYNKFGDTKWMRSDFPKEKSKIRMVVCWIFDVFWFLAIAIAIITPLFVMTIKK